MKRGANKQNEWVRLGKAWLKKELAVFRAPIIWLAVMAVVITALSVSFAYLVQFLIDGAVSQSKDAIIFYVILLVSLLIVRILLQTLKAYFSEQYRAKIIIGLRGRLFSHLLRADYAQLEGYHSGDLLNRITTDVEEVASDSVTLLPATVGMIAQAIGATAALFVLEPIFTAIFVACALVAGLAMALVRKKLKHLQKDISEADGESRAYMQESVASVVTMKAYSAEERAETRSKGFLNKYFSRWTARNRVRTGVSGAMALFGALGTMFAIVWCGVGIYNGSGALGGLFSVLMLIGQLERPVASFSAIMPLYYARAGAAERLSELDSLPCDGSEGECANGVAAISLNGVCFSYGETPVLVGADAELRVGERVCVTGESGSGKSTLFKLLLSIYQPQSGLITVTAEGGERPLSAADRGLFAYVPQGNYLFSGTIRENLSFFAPEGVCSDEEIARALQIACAQFAYDLPEGLDGKLRERGGGLSEGQIQRLAIARALLSNRPILLLDEATSALDGETEQALLRNLQHENITCITVTHRPAALATANKILHLKDGTFTVSTREEE